jgi:DNA-binding MarR family transcriptional regulator
MVLIRLTKKGRQLASQIEVEPMKIFRDALRELPPAELDELFRILGRVQQNVLLGLTAKDGKNTGK